MPRLAGSLPMIAGLVCIGLAIATGALDPPKPRVNEIHVCPVITPYFSPNGGCQKAVIAAIDNACESIYVMAYSFTSRPIEQALAAAKARGLTVVVVADDSNQNPDTSVVDELDNDDVTVWLDGKHAIMHSKVMVIDGRFVLCGSYNWTNAAEKSNGETLLVIEDVELAKAIRSNFETHRQHSRRLR